MITQIEIKTLKLELSCLFICTIYTKKQTFRFILKTILNVKLYWKEHCYIGILNRLLYTGLVKCKLW